MFHDYSLVVFIYQVLIAQLRVALQLGIRSPLDYPHITRKLLLRSDKHANV